MAETRLPEDKLHPVLQGYRVQLVSNGNGTFNPQTSGIRQRLHMYI